MPLSTDFNVNPYYDDYNEDKKFLKILFKPGYAVQARELTQMQSILQKQIQRFGNNIFIDGSIILGGKTHAQDCISLKIDSTFGSNAISISNFSGKTIYNSDLSKRAEVIVAIDADSNSGEPITFLVKQTYGDPFVPGEQIQTSDSLYFATISFSYSNSVGIGQAFSIDEGVIYYGGYFIKFDGQSVAISKYDNDTASLKVGFEVNEYFYSSSNDTSLVDPAQEATNYQAPGADRYKVEMILSTRLIDATDDISNFIEMARYVSGVLQTQNRRTVYNKIGDEFARRTFDESGNYTVTPFSVSSTSNGTNSFDISIGTGKAYVKGYEISVDYPNKITIPTSTATSSPITYQIGGEYGNYFLTTNHANNFLGNSLSTVNLHCVPAGSISTATQARFSNTLIGSAKVKSIDFVTTSNTQSGNNYVYAVSLFDLNLTNLSSNIQSTLSSDSSNVKLNPDFSSIQNAYTGAYLRITSGPGSTESPKLIISYDGTSKNATVFPAFTTIPTTSSNYAIEFNTRHVKSIITNTGTTINSSADISTSIGVDAASAKTSNPRTILFDNKIEELIFPLPVANPKNVTSGNVTFDYVIQRDVSSDGTKFSIAVAPMKFSYGSSSSESDIRRNLKVVYTGGTQYPIGRIIPSNLIGVTSISGATQLDFTVTGASGTGNTVSVLATVTSEGQSTSFRSKNFISANVGYVSVPTTVVVTNQIFTNSAYGQTHITANAIVRTPNIDQPLYLIDGYRLAKILDFSPSGSISDANMATAIDVTSRYFFDSGQRDSYYDFASIRLKPGQNPPVGPIVVFTDKFSHSSQSGYFSIDSYTTSALPIDVYSNNITFTALSGRTYNLRDCLDFRPSITEPTGLFTGKSFNTSDIRIIKRGSTARVTYQHYLPRIDKLTLNSQGIFAILNGVPAQNPIPPRNNDDSITICQIKIPPYTNNTANVSFQYIPNKRFTMEDIGNLEKRIKNLEYYSTLSLLENDALSKSDPSLYGRSKNGIITDSFTGFSTADLSGDDFYAGIDVNSKELKTATVTNFYPLNLYENNSSNFVRNGNLIFLTSDPNVIFAEQNTASNTISVNPYNVKNYIAGLTLAPESDIWLETQILPDLILNEPSLADLQKFISDKKWTDLRWGYWQNFGFSIPFSFFPNINNNLPISKSVSEVTSAGTTTTTDYSLGTENVSENVIPYMRPLRDGIIFRLKDFKPKSNCYPFFRNTNIANNCVRHNYVRFNASTKEVTAAFPLNRSNNENRGCRAAIFNGSTWIGSALVTLTSANTVYATLNTNGVLLNWNSGTIKFQQYKDSSRFPYSTTISDLPILTLATSNAVSHYSGLVNTSTAPTTTSFRLDSSANSAVYEDGVALNTTNLAGKKIRIVEQNYLNPGQNTQYSFITGYNPSTRDLTFSPAFSVAPTGNSIYSIGDFKTDINGRVAGTFRPKTSQFKTGEATFLISDAESNNPALADAQATTNFYSEGTLNKKRKILIRRTTFIPTPQTRRDPIAQTFYVNEKYYPDGIFLSKIGVCFSQKDSILPVTLQVRPAVNGYPSSDVAYPYSEVSMLPSEVNVTSKPNLGDSSTVTYFEFSSPVYLAPGEHSFVLISNSNEYRAWVAVKDELDINGKMISSQPDATGSFFKSQNGSTWTADQDVDMMFRICKHEFSTNKTADVRFEIEPQFLPTSNAFSDLLILQSQETDFGNTSISYSFNSESASNGLKVGHVSIRPRTEYFMLDGYGRRVLNPTSGNTTFELKALMSTSNKDISPVLEVERFGILAIQQVLNNLSLANSDMVVSNTGLYTSSPTLSVAISGGGGSGATAVANVVQSGANWIVDRIFITNPGLGYKTSPAVTITGGTSTYPAIASVNGEDKKNGGNSVCRYLTKKITLADGFNSGDLRVYLTAHKPADSSIDVYYKLLAAGDLENWSDREWQLMTQIDNVNYYSTNINDFAELTFAPGINNVANNSIVYNSTYSGQFNDFNSFSIKIVLSGTNTIDIPRLRDFRAIVIPAA